MDFMIEGGIYFTAPILIMGLSSLGLFAWLLTLKQRGTELNRKRLDLILFLGSFSLIYGIFGQVLGFYQAAGVIQEVGEISPSLIWGGIRVSLIAPIMGFVVLLLSGLFWFILKPRK